jgi:segregation and condensation protein A
VLEAKSVAPSGTLCGDMDEGPEIATLAPPPAALASTATVVANPSEQAASVASQPVATDDYQVRLTSFQGPMDLLLYLIRRAEVDIHDIPIHEITAQYFTFLKQLRYIDIDAAGEFLVTAATLIEIKSRTLAPRPEGSEGGDGAMLADDPSDPRAELVQQLLAYQRFRNAAEALDRLREEYANRWAARIRVSEGETAEEEEAEIELEDAHILDLFQTYERIIAAIDVSRLGEHKVAYDDTPITLHQTDLIDRLKRTPLRRFTLRSVFEGRSRGEMIGLFLATLELARQRQILIKQDELTLEIELELNPEDDGVMHFEG